MVTSAGSGRGLEKITRDHGEQRERWRWPSTSVTTGVNGRHPATSVTAAAARRSAPTSAMCRSASRGIGPAASPRPWYPVLLIDAIVLKIRDRQVANRPVYVAMGITVDGERDVVGLWVGPAGGEGAKQWMNMLTELRNRGVVDVCIVCRDGLKGLPEAIAATCPLATVQTCVVQPGPQSLNARFRQAVRRRGLPDRAAPRPEGPLPDRPGTPAEPHQPTRKINGWKSILNTLAVTFGDRLTIH